MADVDEMAKRAEVDKMAEISVWAPKANKIELQTQGRFLPMEKKDRGWWRISDPIIQHGTSYLFRINGEKAFPDPRSSFQPEGVHGPSCWIDHSYFIGPIGPIQSGSKLH